MLLHFHPFFAVLIFPVLVLGALFFLPFLNYAENTSGVWFCSRKGRRMGVLASSAAILFTPLIVVLDEFFIHFSGWVPALPTLISEGLIPATLLTSAVTVFYACAKRKHRASNNEAVQALFIFLTVSFLVLTIFGMWFRGPGMALTWPWASGG